MTAKEFTAFLANITIAVSIVNTAVDEKAFLGTIVTVVLNGRECLSFLGRTRQ